MWNGKRSMLAGDALNWKTDDPRFMAEVRERFAQDEREAAAEMRAERAGLFPEEEDDSDSSSDESCQQPLSQMRRTVEPTFSNPSDHRERPITPVTGASGSGSHAAGEVAALKQEIKQLNERHRRRVTELQRANQRLVHENAALRAGHGADASTSTMSRRMSMMAMLMGNMEDENLGEREASDAEVAKLRRDLERERSARLSAEAKLQKSITRR